jgi:Helix-turn-helix domain
MAGGTYPSYIIYDLHALRTHDRWQGKWARAHTLAAAVGLSIAQYRRIETGRNGTTGPVVLRLARVLKTTPAVLTRGRFP